MSYAHYEATGEWPEPSKPSEYDWIDRCSLCGDTAPDDERERDTAGNAYCGQCWSNLKFCLKCDEPIFDGDECWRPEIGPQLPLEKGEDLHWYCVVTHLEEL